VRDLRLGYWKPAFPGRWFEDRCAGLPDKTGVTLSRIEHLAEGVTLYLGDCREVLPTLGRFDAIVTDPPYGIGESSARVASRGKLAMPKDYGSFEWDKAPPPSWLIQMLQDVSDWQIIFGGNYYDLPPSSCWLVWDKKNGSNDFADCELAWTNMSKAVRKIEWLWNGMIRKGSDVREHPTQKPVGVMSWAIDQLPDDVTLVCDPFMGSGTTGIAAVTRGLSFIGIERDPAYFEIAVARVSEALQRPSLLVVAPKPAKQEAML